MSDCVSKYRLMQYLSKELSDADHARILDHIDGCATCHEAAESMKANIAAFDVNKEILLTNLMSSIEKEAEGRVSWITRRRLFVGGLAAAAAVLLVLVIIGRNPASDSTDADVIAFKGRWSVEVVAKRGTEQFAVADGAILHENDALRFVVTTATPGYLTVFSIDDDDKLWPYYPESRPEDEPAPLAIGTPGRHELAGSVVLDGSRGSETLVILFSDTSFNRKLIMDMWQTAQKSGETVPMGKEILVESIQITKE